MLAYLVFVFLIIGRYLTMTLAQLERRLRLVEARNHGSDYVAIQDAIDDAENERENKSDVEAAFKAVQDTRSPLPGVDTRRFEDESDSEYAARVYGA